MNTREWGEAVARGEYRVMEAVRASGIAQSSISAARDRALKRGIGVDPVRSHGQVDRVGGITDAPPDPDKTWERLESTTATVSDEVTRAEFKVKDKLPIGIAFVSDQHIGSNGTDHKRLKEDAQLIGQTPGLYAVLAGDSMDNHICIPNAVLHASTLPDAQLSAVELYLGWFNDKILALISGNHDVWTYAKAGIDCIRRLAAQEKIFYRRDELHATINHGGVEYRIAVRHKYRFNSSLNQTHSHKRWLKEGQWDWDIGVLAHLHESAYEEFWHHRRVRYAIRPGSYLVKDAYGEGEGHNPCAPTCPTVILYPGTKRIVGFSDLRAAVEYLQAVRG